MKNNKKIKDDVQVLIVTDKGYTIRTSIEEFKTSHKATKGVRAIRTNNGEPVSVCFVDDTSKLFVLTKKGQGIKIDANEIRITARGTTGIKLVKLADDDSVVDIIGGI